jgi:hypothetical protein
MNRLISGKAVTLAVLVLVGCSTDPTDDLRNGIDRIVASPGQVFLEPGKSAVVEVGAVDGQGNPLSFPYTVTSVRPGITVKRDSTFLPVYVNDTLLTVPETAPRMRFVVTADPFTGSFPVSSFTITAGGDSVVVPVQVAPIGSYEATFSTLTPALGDTVTITAAAGSVFSDTTALEFVGAPQQPVIVDRAADGSSIRFLIPPNSGGPLRVTSVTTASAPGVLLAPLTTQALTGVQIDSLDVTFSNPAPAIGGAVTVTPVNPLIKFQQDLDTLGAPVFTSNITFPLEVAAPAAITVAPDSSTLSFEAPPNAAGVARIDSLVFPGGYTVSLPTRQAITVPSIGTTFAATFSNNAPGLGEVITLTPPANFRFDPTVDSTGAYIGSTTLTFGTKIGAIQSVAADGSSLTFLPLPGTTGPAVVTGLTYTPAPQFSVTLPTVQEVTTAEITPLPNADHPTTAPAITVPAPGGTTTLFDAGPFNGPGDCCFGGPTRLYRVDLTTAATLTGSVDWFEGQDLGMYWVAADGITPIGDFSGDSGGAGAHPETETITLAPGTYFMAIANFGDGDPNLIKLTLSRAP